MSQTANPLFSRHEELGKWYDPVQLNCDTVVRRARRQSSLRGVLEVLGRLRPDAYSTYLTAYLQEGIEKFGEDWDYLDITNVLLAASSLARPRNYLEIGVRTGRSMAMVATATPEVNIVGFDMWGGGDYAGMANPGAAYVAEELKRLEHRGSVRFVEGDSHKTVPAFFRENPQTAFDLITVDGDHSEAGALDDLQNVLPHLTLGGILVFDDIQHPQFPFLLEVWRKALKAAPFRMRSFEYTNLGYGIAVGMRVA